MAKKRNGMSESDAGKLGGIKTKQFYYEKLQNKIKEYLLNPNYCLYCGKIIPFEKRFNKCCCRSCATSYGNKLHSYESRLQQSKKIKSTTKIIKEKQLNQKCKKIEYCKFCGAEKGKCKDKFVCSKYQLYNTLEKFGFDKSKIGTENIINEFYKAKDIIEHEYKINRITDKELKEKYNYKSGLSNFHKVIKSLNIKTFNSKKANKISISLGRLNPGFNYKHFKEYLHKSWQGNIYNLRSSYEDIYANELDRNKINYDYENLIIKYWDSQKQEYRNAIPDFYLIDNNMIVEIKSSYTLDKQNMIDKKKAYLDLGYNFKCICDFKEIDI